MKTTPTITLLADGPLLMAAVQGAADELSQCARIVDAIRSEAVRVDSGEVLVDLSALDGSMVPNYQAELEHYTAARLAPLTCALVLPPDCVIDDRKASRTARLGVFPTVPQALDWLQERSSEVVGPAPLGGTARTIVHLL